MSSSRTWERGSETPGCSKAVGKVTSDYVQICVETLLHLAETSLGDANAATCRWPYCGSVSLLLIAPGSRGILARQAGRGKLLPSVAATVAESSGHVSFSDDELVAIGVDPADLNPFVFQGEPAELLVGQSIGHTALERRPLVRFGGRMTVVLPTAIGAAIRRFVIERASTAGDLRLFQSTCHLAQFSEVFLLGGADWDVEYMRMLEPDPDDGLREFVGAFDDDGYVHVLFVPDDFEEIAREGLASIHKLEDAMRGRIHDRVAELAREGDCRKGLVVLVHGGIGREFSPVWGDLPHGWHQLCVSAPDFMLLGSETDFTAMRAWKLLQRVDELEAKDVVLSKPARVLEPGGFRV